ncbi:MAG: beta-lactamase family protein [Sedimentisphaerales bacterium]|nr:beta-lactamase family protein [Sedimentisphaerales bacterium]
MMTLSVDDSVCERRGRTVRGWVSALSFVFLLTPCLCFGSGDRIVPVIESVRQAYDVPAVAAAVILDGRVCGVAARGVRKAGSDVKVTSVDQFHLGSCTKAMTATLIAILIEQGKLRWDATLAELLPDLVEDMRPAYRTVTIRHLLAHRAGLPGSGASWPEGMSFRDVHRLPGAPMQQRLAYTRLILRQEPTTVPGEEYLYSNAGFAVAGTIAEQIMKTPYETLMQEMVFEPLGMGSAGFGAMGTPGKIDQPWQHRFSDGKLKPIGPGRFSDNPPAIGPGGTVHCSMGDWAKFVLAHLKGRQGVQTILPPSSITELHTPDFGGDYAKGWAVKSRDWAGGEVLTHTGTNNQNYAVVWMAPKRNFAVMAATNQGGGDVAKACDDVCAALIKEFLAK